MKIKGNNLNLLFVSIAFPPKKDPECIQTARYFKYLSQDERIHIDVFTSAIPTLFMPVDESLQGYDQGWRQKITIPIAENKYLNFLKRKIGIPFLPDTKSSFHKQWKKSYNLKIKPDVIYSRSYPLSSTLAAFKIATYFDVPWILHLSDPWVDSPLHDYSLREKKHHIKWEKKCFGKAKYICLTSQKSIEFYSKKYPEYVEKFKLFPNVYDPEDLSNDSIDLSKRCRVIYAGGFAGTRSPKTY